MSGVAWLEEGAEPHSGAASKLLSGHSSLVRRAQPARHGEAYRVAWLEYDAEPRSGAASQAHVRTRELIQGPWVTEG